MYLWIQICFQCHCSLSIISDYFVQKQISHCFWLISVCKRKRLFIDRCFSSVCSNSVDLYFSAIAMKWRTRWYFTSGFLPCGDTFLVFYIQLFKMKILLLLLSVLCVVSKHIEADSTFRMSFFFLFIEGKFHIWSKTPNLMWWPLVVQAASSRRCENLNFSFKRFWFIPFSLSSLLFGTIFLIPFFTVSVL